MPKSKHLEPLPIGFPVKLDGETWYQCHTDCRWRNHPELDKATRTRDNVAGNRPQDCPGEPTSDRQLLASHEVCTNAEFIRSCPGYSPSYSERYLYRYRRRIYGKRYLSTYTPRGGGNWLTDTEAEREFPEADFSQPY